MMLHKLLQPFKRRLLYKMLAINLFLVFFVIAFIWVAVDYLAADYFSLLMQKYHISPDDAHNMFVLSVHNYLLAAIVIAVTLVILLNYFITRRVLKPVSDMNNIIHKMEKGHYQDRVQTDSQDEVGQLANAFNHLVERLNKVEQLRQDMVEDVSHELRTPLTNIRGYLEGLQDKVVPPSKATLNILTNEVNRLIDLVKSFQRTTRANASKGHLTYTEVNLPDLMKEISTLYAERIRQKRLKLSCKIPDIINTIQADRQLLLQIISNLLDNASRYTPEGGWVNLELNDNNTAIQFSVSNNCEPFDPEELSLLTERFYRPEKSRSRESGGAGIGLSIVKQLVEAHQGSMQLESLSDGLKIDFSLPKHPEIPIT